MMKGRGWVHMRGKRTKRLWCGCCVAIDERPKQRAKIACQEVKAALRGMSRGTG
jgi:hypothetical protein